ncbi:rhamnose ABC transporter substrate-binding protein [Tersicoccus sp. Bi-70]|uniref:rhamnose ABC transporter substrate-binding protein n=1 Tax=Tersicoccus sp. Bi-70 TaxID=1897634 RepID=UPI000977FFB6|nr:rhamnose ABC transporter substrate-binding protein [Tersicoccus sp. Bi-70]OMH36731.1 rhamnose ABC transporter substrate-binding protein [Tersicoccus sp. Bi-70]
MKLTAPSPRITALAGAAVALALVATGCAAPTPGGSSSGGSGSAAGKNYAIAFLPKNLGNPYFDASDKAGQQAVEGFGGTYKEVGPQQASADGQVSYINTLTQQKTGAIVLSANDVNALCSAIGQAKSAGVKVVTFDSDTKPGCRDVYVSASSTELIGQKQMDIMAKQIGSSGKVAILSASANATNQNAWNEAMKKYTASKYPNIQIVATVYGNDDDQTSYDKTQALLSQYPDLKGIISPTTVGIAAAARYLDSKKSSVKLTGLGDPQQMVKYVKDGTVPEFALWNPQDLGKLGAFAAKALIDGTITGKEGDKLTAEGLSNKTTEFTVGADGVITLGPPFVFDKSNIDQFKF